MSEMKNRTKEYTVYVCTVLPFILNVRFVDAPAWVPQQKGHIGFLDLPSAVLAFIFILRRIQPSLSLVDCEVEFCIPTNQSFSTCWAYVFFRANPGSCDCAELRTHVPTSEGFEATN